MRKIKDFLARPKTKYVAIPLAILILFGLAFAFSPAQVRVGERTQCKYGEIIEDNTKLVTVPRFLSSYYGIKTTKTTCAKHRTCEKLYDDASRNIAHGDLKTAGKILNTIKKRDPEFKNVDKKIKEVNKELVAAGQPPITTGLGSTVPSTSGGQSGEATGSSEQTNGASSSDGKTSGKTKSSGGDSGTSEYEYLLGLLPEELPGYILYDERNETLDAFRRFTRGEGSEIELVTFLVDLRGNKEDAEAFIDHTIKMEYPSNKDNNVQVKGRKCYFGTSASQFAILAWPRDGLVYQVEMYNGKDAKQLKDDVIEMSKKVK